MKSFKDFNREEAKITEVEGGWTFRGKKYKTAKSAQTAFNKYAKAIAPSIVVLTWDTKTQVGAAVVKALSKQ